MSSGPPGGIQGGSFWKASRNKDFLLFGLVFRFGVICLTAYLYQYENISGFLVLVCEKEHALQKQVETWNL